VPRPILAEVLALGVGAFYQMRVGEKRLRWVRAGEIFSRVVASRAREQKSPDGSIGRLLVERLGWRRLVVENLLYLARLLLDLSGDFLVGSFILQARIVGGLADLLFHFAFDFVQRSFGLVFGAVLHGSLQKERM
jgi:hypothetical protein